jgi:hypothetical protein
MEEMMGPNLYARVKPLNPRQGYVLNRYHFLGNLFVGGQRPNWYKITEEYAGYCRADRQETGVDSFDVVTEAEKVAIDAKEEQLHLVELGLLSATVAGPAARQAMEIKMPTDKAAPARGNARTEAVPVTASKSLDGGELSHGDLTTKDFGIGAK